MKKQILCAALAVLLTTGCAQKAPTVSSPEAAVQASHTASFLPINLLPENFIIPADSITDTACSIFCIGQQVGGIIKTDLSTDVLVNSDYDAVGNYLGKFVPEGLVFDTMIDGGYPITADLVLVNPDTKASREFMHYLYEKDGFCYDLWLDFAYLQYWEHKEILVASGVAHDLEITKPNADYAPNFENTGLNLGEPNGNTCPILSDGAVIGGYEYTGLAPVVLHEKDDFLNMADFHPEYGYTQMSVSEFRIRKYLQKYNTEGWAAEYDFMYENQDDANRSVSVFLVLTNRETEEKRSFLHHFYSEDAGQIYDVWSENTAASQPEGAN